MNQKHLRLIAILLAVLTILSVAVAGFMRNDISSERTTAPIDAAETVSAQETTYDTTFSESEFVIPEYTGSAWVELNGNMPEFEDFDTTTVFETYSELDSLGRCGVAFANICQELMPRKTRGDISSVEPSGWTYNGKSNNRSFPKIDGGYIYNRCHLIGFQLAGENDNEKNLITGTRQLNIEGMLPFENKVAKYANHENRHVLYRATPIFKDDELVCRGVQLEGYSVEDDGEEICFNVYCFNVQDGYSINYATGQVSVDDNSVTATTATTATAENVRYVVNEKNNKFHNPDCSAVEKINPSNKMYLVSSRDELIKLGYSACGICKP